MNNNTNTTPPMPEYVDRWTAKMVEIWRDRLDLLGVYHTGNLRQSVTKGNVNVNGLDADISFQFLRYGIYVDRGVGNGYTRGNGATLLFWVKLTEWSINWGGHAKSGRGSRVRGTFRPK